MLLATEAQHRAPQTPSSARRWRGSGAPRCAWGCSSTPCHTAAAGTPVSV